jgi:hypothetical protein
MIKLPSGAAQAGSGREFVFEGGEGDGVECIVVSRRKMPNPLL